MRKRIAILLVLALVLALSGCKSSDYKQAVTAMDAGNYQEALTALLGDETARQLTALEQEVWFSDHPIEEPQRQQAQKLLEGTERLWRERVPAARRWKQRFLTCQVI